MPSHTPLRLTAITRSQSASSVSTIVSCSSTPALLWAKSRCPKASTVLATTAWQSAATVTSPGTKTAWPPSCSMRCTVSSPSAWREGEVGDEHPGGALARQRQRGGPPDAARRPRHQSRLALDQTRHLPSFSFQAAIARASSTSRAICSTQRLDRLEALLAAQALEELDAQRRAVEVAVEVHEEGLDELAAAGDEHRPHADVGGRGVHRAVGRPRAARVDAVAGDDVAVGGHEVGRREAERRARACRRGRPRA